MSQRPNPLQLIFVTTMAFFAIIGCGCVLAWVL